MVEIIRNSPTHFALYDPGEERLVEYLSRGNPADVSVPDVDIYCISKRNGLDGKGVSFIFCPQTNYGILTQERQERVESLKECVLYRTSGGSLDAILPSPYKPGLADLQEIFSRVGIEPRGITQLTPQEIRVRQIADSLVSAPGIQSVQKDQYVAFISRPSNHPLSWRSVSFQTSAPDGIKWLPYNQYNKTCPVAITRHVSSSEDFSFEVTLYPRTRFDRVVDQTPEDYHFLEQLARQGYLWRYRAMMMSITG